MYAFLNLTDAPQRTDKLNDYVSFEHGPRDFEGRDQCLQLSLVSLPISTLGRV